MRRATPLARRAPRLPDSMTEASGAFRMQPWSDREIARFQFREALFRRRGLAPAAAEALGDRLARRDQERDDRRCCAECSNWQQSRTCFKQLPTSFIQLVRCPDFDWQRPQ